MIPVNQWHPKAQTLDGIPDEDVDDLDVLVVEYPDGHHGAISCWRPSWREVLTILFRRRVYLMVLGDAHPPVSLAASEEDLGLRDPQRLTLPQKAARWLASHGPPGWTWLALMNRFVGDRLRFSVLYDTADERYYLHRWGGSHS